MTAATDVQAAATASNLVCFMGEPLLISVGFGQDEWLAQAWRSLRRFRGSSNYLPEKGRNAGNCAPENNGSEWVTR
jgi:hypothetical protein